MDEWSPLPNSEVPALGVGVSRTKRYPGAPQTSRYMGLRIFLGPSTTHTFAPETRVGGRLFGAASGLLVRLAAVGDLLADRHGSGAIRAPLLVVITERYRLTGEHEQALVEARRRLRIGRLT
jgi:hypothetical protein